MKKIIIILASASLLIWNTSCEEVVDQIQKNTTNSDSSDAKISNGLKEALRVGTDSAVTKLNKTDGYFKDAAIKILLPQQIQNALNTFKSKNITVLGQTVTGETLYSTGMPSLGINPLKSKEEDLILGINRAAEKAAVDAKPIFVNAITSMTIADANNILFGGVDTAATGYLRTNTYSGLFQNFEPKINDALNAVKIGDKSVALTYENFVADYNALLNTSVPSLSGSTTIASLMGIQPIAATDLSEYSTNKALNGLFIKVKDKEAEIRENPLARVTDLLKEVFGQLD
jgi:hypothetical protein